MISSQTSTLQSSLAEIKTMLSSQNSNGIKESTVEFDPTNYDINFDLVITWTEARSQCQNKGMELVSINSQQEFDYITSLLNSMIRQLEINCMYIWTSGNNNNNNGDWLWGNSENPVTYVWDLFQPDGYFVESACAAIYIFTEFKMSAAECSDQKCFLCEIIQ